MCKVQSPVIAKVKVEFQIRSIHCPLNRHHSGICLMFCRLQQELHRCPGPHPYTDTPNRVYSDDTGTSELYYCTLFLAFLPTSKWTMLRVFSWGEYSTDLAPYTCGGICHQSVTWNCDIKCGTRSVNAMKCAGQFL